jgi:hypothetical protein
MTAGLNDSPKFIQALGQIVIEAISSDVSARPERINVSPAVELMAAD